MALAHSPKIVTDGLVFAYDMGNTQKSWKGAPTTNLLAQPLSFQTGYTSESWSTGEIIDNNQIAPDGTQSATKITRVSGYFYKRNAISPTFTITPGQTITFSCWVKKLDSTNQTGRGIYIWCYDGAGSANRTVATQEIFNNIWVRQSVTYTALTGETDFSFGFSGSAANHLQGSIAIWKPQVEISSYATPFVNGTRSNAQAIVNLMNNNIVTANSLTYASDNTFSFNGSTNYITTTNTGLTHGITNFSYSCWASWSSKPGYGTLFENGTWTSSLIIRFETNGITIYSMGTYYGKFTFDPTLNTWYHMFFIRNGNNIELYINGVYNSSIAFGTSVNIIPNTSLIYIGMSQHAAGQCFNGKIATAQIYNRALSAAEVQQNFNSLRTRYGV